MNFSKLASMLFPFWFICQNLILLFSSNLICFQPSGIAATLGNQTDHLALLKFKATISKDPYGTLGSWNSSSHFCTWNGIICSHRHERVRVLNLQGYGLHGLISPHLGNLSFLRILNLNNSFNGEIPRELGRLLRLQELMLANNTLAGNIPINLTNCSQLKGLYLERNDLTGKIPKEIDSLSKLERLFLSRNMLTSQIPNSIGNLSSLSILFANGNSLEGSPPEEIGHMKNLTTLKISVNKLSGLQFLDLSQNNFSGSIPQVLQGISTLEYLNISFNVSDGEVPTKGVFGNASAVAVIGNNKLCGGISELQLPPCPMKATKKQKRQYHKLVVVIICVVVFLLLLSSILTIYCLRKRNRKSSSDSSTIDLLSKVSYQSLYQATDGFSPSNLIGTGGFGSVYKGRLGSEEGVVAIKVLNLQRTGADKSFIAECNALRNIRHRNLVKILTCCFSIDYKGQTFKALVFEYMTNGCLENWLHHGIETAEHPRTLDLCQRLNVVIDIASVLHYLYIECKPPICHCDLKPSNILLDDDMIARVGDFGLARLLSTITSLSNTSTIGIKGTIGYAPPEYGMGSEVLREGDMYSFGILMLEILTGRRPTEEMFKEGYNLHNHVRTALPDNLSQIIDPALLPREFQQTTTAATEAEIDLENPTHLHPNVNKCLLSLCRIGLACSVESPNERMNVVDVTKELNLIKKAFLADGINGGRARI
ncbi:hypothetical protein L6164_001585 [Bauhinia variegata]|uniref:Uncharacterized protein n=1 Tax=Bauhinia variegata TaxID=167791 RepID=A0ACB9QA58_BAUVA|nr:hypothetical protein L6164_001585 [Bauhinia variegata]